MTLWNLLFLGTIAMIEHGMTDAWTQTPVLRVAEGLNARHGNSSSPVDPENSTLNHPGSPKAEVGDLSVRVMASSEASTKSERKAESVPSTIPKTKTDLDRPGVFVEISRSETKRNQDNLPPLGLAMSLKSYLRGRNNLRYLGERDYLNSLQLLQSESFTDGNDPKDPEDLRLINATSIIATIDGSMIKVSTIMSVDWLNRSGDFRQDGVLTPRQNFSTYIPDASSGSKTIFTQPYLFYDQRIFPCEYLIINHEYDRNITIGNFPICDEWKRKSMSFGDFHDVSTSGAPVQDYFKNFRVLSTSYVPFGNTYKDSYDASTSHVLVPNSIEDFPDVSLSDVSIRKTKPNFFKTLLRRLRYKDALVRVLTSKDDHSISHANEMNKSVSNKDFFNQTSSERYFMVEIPTFSAEVHSRWEDDGPTKEFKARGEKGDDAIHVLRNEISKMEPSSPNISYGSQNETVQPAPPQNRFKLNKLQNGDTEEFRDKSTADDLQNRSVPKSSQKRITTENSRGMTSSEIIHGETMALGTQKGTEIRGISETALERFHDTTINAMSYPRNELITSQFLLGNESKGFFNETTLKIITMSSFDGITTGPLNAVITGFHTENATGQHNESNTQDGFWEKTALKVPFGEIASSLTSNGSTMKVHPVKIQTKGFHDKNNSGIYSKPTSTKLIKEYLSEVSANEIISGPFDQSKSKKLVSAIRQREHRNETYINEFHSETEISEPHNMTEINRYRNVTRMNNSVNEATTKESPNETSTKAMIGEVTHATHAPHPPHPTHGPGPTFPTIPPTPPTVSPYTYCGDGIHEVGEECDCGTPLTCDFINPCCVPKGGLGNLLECTYNTRKCPNVNLCGNGYIDAGEDCDCGDVRSCRDTSEPCCNATTCKFEDAYDKVACTVTENDCRQSYCNGTSSTCPPEVEKKKDGVACARGSQTCDHGTCKSTVCLDHGLQDCKCPEGVFCSICCSRPDEKICKTTFEFGYFTSDRKAPFLAAGTPCGYQPKQVCVSMGVCTDEVRQEMLRLPPSGKGFLVRNSLALVIFVTAAVRIVV